mmetsp:Transcript_3252/g.9531  ORF Transcript_3252/g.9531 Transcript_3252/m.9531 type:complete len:342 (+) Transcript_3252:211-1236(+)
MAPRGPPSTSSWQPLASLKLESTVRARSRITCEHCGPEVSSISQRRTSKVDSLPSSERSRPPQPVSTGGRQCSGTGRRSSGFRRVSCCDCRAPRVLLLRRKTPPARRVLGVAPPPLGVPGVPGKGTRARGRESVACSVGAKRSAPSPSAARSGRRRGSGSIGGHRSAPSPSEGLDVGEEHALGVCDVDGAEEAAREEPWEAWVLDSGGSAVSMSVSRSDRPDRNRAGGAQSPRRPPPRPPRPPPRRPPSGPLPRGPLPGGGGNQDRGEDALLPGVEVLCDGVGEGPRDSATGSLGLSQMCSSRGRSVATRQLAMLACQAGMPESAGGIAGSGAALPHSAAL